jgi:hypothetical protein
VAELADALDLGSSSGNRMGVQISPLAPAYSISHPLLSTMQKLSRPGQRLRLPGLVMTEIHNLQEDIHFL